MSVEEERSGAGDAANMQESSSEGSIGALDDLSTVTRGSCCGICSARYRSAVGAGGSPSWCLAPGGVGLAGTGFPVLLLGLLNGQR